MLAAIIDFAAITELGMIFFTEILLKMLAAKIELGLITELDMIFF